MASYKYKARAAPVRGDGARERAQSILDSLLIRFGIFVMHGGACKTCYTTYTADEVEDD